MTNELGAEHLERAECAGCGCEGYSAATSAGEVERDGEIIGVIPAGATALLVGRTNGDDVDDRFCERCAELQLIIDDTQRGEVYPARMRYEGQTEDQPAYLQMDQDGRVTVGYSGEVGNGIPEAVFHRRTLRWSIPSTCTLAELESLYDDVKGILARIHRGHLVESNGANMAGTLNDDAEAADDELDDYLGGWRDEIHQNGHFSRHPEDWEDPDGEDADTDE